MRAACGDGDEIVPAGDVAPAIVVRARGDGRAVGAQADGMDIARGDGDEIVPAGDVALAMEVITRGGNGAVGAQADGMIAACGDGVPLRDPGPQGGAARPRVPVPVRPAKGNGRLRRPPRLQ